MCTSFVSDQLCLFFILYDMGFSSSNKSSFYILPLMFPEHGLYRHKLKMPSGDWNMTPSVMVLTFSFWLWHLNLCFRHFVFDWYFCVNFPSIELWTTCRRFFCLVCETTRRTSNLLLWRANLRELLESAGDGRCNNFRVSLHVKTKDQRHSASFLKHKIELKYVFIGLQFLFNTHLMVKPVSICIFYVNITESALLIYRYRHANGLPGVS